MSSLHVFVHNVLPPNLYLTPSRSISTKEDSGIVIQPIQLNHPHTSFHLAATVGTKRSVKCLFHSVTNSLFLEEQVAKTWGLEDSTRVQREHDPDNFGVGHLIRKLASSGDLKKVNEVFSAVLKPDAYVWSAVISAHSNLGEFAKAVRLYHLMIDSKAVPDGHVFASVIRACSGLLDIEQGIQLHASVLKYGFDSDIFINNTLLSMYAKCGNLEDVHVLFKSLEHLQDVVTWSTVIQAYTEHGYPLEAYDLFLQMQQEGIEMNEFTYVCLLKACSDIGDAEPGERIHSCVIESGFESDLFIGNTLMDMYKKCDSFHSACVLINKLVMRDVVTWSVVISGFAERGMLNETFQAFQEMQENGVKPDQGIYVCLTKACQSSEALRQARHVHCFVIERGLELDNLVGSTVVEMYFKCENIEDAHAVFERLSKQNVSNWNALIRGYCQFGYCQKALQIIQSMEYKLDMDALICLVCACSSSRDLSQGTLAHCHLIKFGFELNNSVGNALIDMYSKCGSFEDVYVLFNQLRERDVVSWNIIIAWHAQNCCRKEARLCFERMQEEGLTPNQVTWNALIAAQSCFLFAIEVFAEMQHVGVAPDKVTFLCILRTCCRDGSLEQGMQLHNYVIRFGFDVDILIQNTLIDLYAKLDSLQAACLVFDKVTRRDIVTWNVLLSGQSLHGHAQECLALFQRMQQDNVTPDQATFVATLQACSSIAVLENGREIHDQVTERGLELNLHVGNSLIDFYAKCGRMEDALVLFNRLPEQDEVIYSTLISGHSKHCNYILASQCFHDMQDEGLRPNAGVYLSLLAACGHVGLLNEGCFYFKSMQQEYGIMPTLDHHVAMVELFGKTGRLKEAEELLEILPSSADAVGWTSLLGSCKKYGFISLAEQCFEHLVAIKSEKSSGYVLMSRIYEHAGMDDSAEEVAELRKSADLWKQPAKAYIEVDKEVHEFAVADTTHPRSEEIYAKLGELNADLKHEGYSPCVGLVQEGSSVESKEKSLWAHSEKLALAFGLLCTPEGTTIRVAKNLRVCADCHDVATLISKKERRDIVIKDIHCIHHFKDGACCCGEHE